jgi:hypothetical protein
VLASKETCTTEDEVIKSINVKDANDWISAAWKETTPVTIEKCFRKSGFLAFDGFDSDSVTSAMDSDSVSDNDFSDLENLMKDVGAKLGLDITVEAYI